MDFILLLIGVIVVAYIMLYTSDRFYLKEGFQSLVLANAAPVTSPDQLGNDAKRVYDRKIEKELAAEGVQPINTGDIKADKPCIQMRDDVIMEQRLEAPYLQNAIQNVDDYEYNLVFQGEGDREVNKALLNKLQSQYPLDWSGLPPSAARFQQGVQELRESFKNAPAEPAGVHPYKEISGVTMTPPDTSIQEMEERKILQTYQPKNIGDLSTYNLEDAMALINRIYDAKGLIPEVRKRDGNIYDVIGTRPKDAKIVYEDEAPAQKTPYAQAGEGTITVPPTAVDVAAGLDPFFTPTDSARVSRWDYQKFTPGLERMFAPTYPTTEWY